MRIQNYAKRMVCLASAAVMAASLTACGGNAAATAETTVGTTAAAETTKTAETKNEETKAPETKAEAKAEKGVDKIVMVWYPNESASDYEPAREEFGRLISEVTGKPVEQKLTTDYSIAIESLANGTAQICFMGAQGYVEAKNKNDAVKPLFVNSGA